MSLKTQSTVHNGMGGNWGITEMSENRDLNLSPCNSLVLAKPSTKTWSETMQNRSRASRTCILSHLPFLIRSFLHCKLFFLLWVVPVSDLPTSLKILMLLFTELSHHAPRLSSERMTWGHPPDGRCFPSMLALVRPRLEYYVQF